MEGFYLKKDLYMIFTIKGLVNLLNYFSRYVCCLMSIFVDLPVFWHRDNFVFCFVFRVCNILHEYNANNHILIPSVSLLISDNVVPNS